MLFSIIGGSEQGKLALARREYEQLYKTSPIICDAGLMAGDLIKPEELKQHFMLLLDYAVIDHLHLFVRVLSLSCNDKEYQDLIEKWLTKLEQSHLSLQIVIMDDIGSGVVPLTSEDRIWRERCGRLYCRINEISAYALRVWAGLPQVLKDERNSTMEYSKGAQNQ